MSHTRELLASRRFLPLFLTQFFGAFNDNFLKNALVILITFKASSIMGIPSSQMVALAGGIFILPFFVFSATAGQLADKYEKGRLIRIIKIAEILIMVLAAVGFLTEHFEFLLIVLFLMGLHSTFFGPLKYSILPQHLTADELVGGNALVEAGTFLAILLGTILGGVLIARDSGSVWVSVGLFLVALVGWAVSLAIPKAPAVDPGLRVQWTAVAPTLEIYRFTRKNRTVFLSILGISWFWFFGGAVLSLFPAYCKDVLQADESVVTLFLATFSVGIGAGSMLCERLSRDHLELGLVPLGSIGITIFAAYLHWVGVPVWPAGLPAPLDAWTFVQQGAGMRILVDLLLLSVFSGLYIVPLYTLIQERSEVSHRSRIIAGNNIVNALFMVVSAVLIMVLMRLELAIPQMFSVLAAINAAVALYIYTVLPEFLFRFIVWIVANLMYRLRIQGLEQVPKTGGAILVCNHVSFVDWLIIMGAIKRPVRFIMDFTYIKGFFMRRLLMRAKVIPIATSKENPGVLRRAFELAAAELRDGEVVCIFPEGKITFDGKINLFKPGVEKILQMAPVPVVPMALRGMWGSFFSREGGRAIRKMPRRFWSRIELRIGTPVAAETATAALLHEKVSELRGNDRL